jgi:glycosyltransferase involved in cell wall biosynthesis
MAKTRIAILNSHPIQYFAPLYAFLNAAPDLDITALYLSDTSIRGVRDPGFDREVKWDIDLLAGYHSVFLGKAAHTRVPAGFMSLIAPEVWDEVRSGHYDVLWLYGHNYAANHIAFAAAKSRKMPVMMRGETHLGLGRQGLRAMLRRPVMGAFYGLCDSCLAIGTANAEFYRAMGVPDSKIFLVPYSVDNDRFIAAAQLGAKDRRAARAELGIADDAPVILYASKLQRRKHPDGLIRAAHKLATEKLKFHLVFVGAGEMNAELADLVARLGMSNVVFRGFVNQSELPRVYAACDLFVLPSENEPWGLIVNEVMCAGLPVVVSEEVGCVADLVKHGENGFTFPAGDVDRLAAALRPLVQDPNLRKRMSEAAVRRISGWGYQHCLEGVRDAVRYLGASSQADVTMLERTGRAEP